MPEDRSEEADLIRAAISGDTSAFMTLVQTHDRALRGLAFSMTGSQSGMDDVLQESYLKAFRSIGSFKFKSSFKSWLWRIVMNTATDELRRTSRFHLVAETSEQSRSEDVALRLDVEAALQQLPFESRAVVLLIDGEGFDYATTAEILGMPPGTVSSKIHSARAALRKALETSWKEYDR